MAPLSTVNVPVPSRSRPSQTAVALRVGMRALPSVRVSAAPCRTSWAVAFASARATALVMCLTVALAACGRDTHKAPAGGASATAGADSVVDTLPTLEPSLVEVPVRYELEPAIATLERAVPRSVGNLDERKPI